MAYEMPYNEMIALANRFRSTDVLGARGLEKARGITR